MKKILIVEDEETSRRILTLALQGEDRVLLHAHDGDEALRIAMAEKPDLIVMDMSLPRMDGFQATKLIKSNQDLKHIPVVALTARTAKYDETRAREAGCDEYITKPYRMLVLREKLEKYL